MSNKKADISQIRKYLDGELDARAMHQLEREAQGDPFLMEAMEGFEQAGADQQANLNDLENRLQARTEKEKVRPLWPYISAAASLLIVFTIGFWLWPHGVQENIPNDKRVAAVIDHSQVKADTVLPPTTIKTDQSVIASAPVPPKANQHMAVKPSAQPPVAAEEINAASPAADQGLLAKEQTAADQYNTTNNYKSNAYNSRIAQNYGYNFPAHADSTDRTALYKKTNRSAAQLKEVQVPGKSAPAAPGANAAIATALQGRVAGVQVTTPEHKVVGTIYDEMGVPLPGVNVSIANSQVGTVTDANGRFALAARNGQMLDIKYIGYNQKTIAAKDSLSVALSASQASLSEVVVVGYGTARTEVDNSAHPKTGWDNYNQYLKNRAVVTDGQTGLVRLSFTVAADGSLNDFKVLKSLSPTADQTAIDLVKDGPAWQPAANGKTKTIKLRIRFNKK